MTIPCLLLHHMFPQNKNSLPAFVVDGLEGEAQFRGDLFGFPAFEVHADNRGVVVG